MRPFIAASIISVFISLAGVQAAPAADPNAWTPDAVAAARVDAAAMRLALPEEFGAIGGYARYYWGTVRNGRRVIEGILVSPAVEHVEGKIAPQRVNIVPENAAPSGADGGCMFVHVEFDVEIGKLTQSQCNFDGPRSPPPQPPLGKVPMK